jgi:hypothetical protein|tara:strand:+ start:123 stop:338 length:216 start_codon:yes stop_codon:yes gene_type:complete
MAENRFKGKTLDEINEETNQTIKGNQKSRWKDNQLDRIENKINKIQSTLGNISFFGGILLIIIAGIVINDF